MIDFLAFDGDSGAIRARVDLVGDRLADLLSRGGSIRALDVEVVDLRTGSRAAASDRALDPDRFAIVVATGPRGARGKRLETAFRPVSLAIGGYLVHGYLHAVPPADPVRNVADRTWIPMTEAVLEYRLGGRVCRERFDTLLVNRGAIESVAVISVNTHEVHWLAGGQSSVFPDVAVGV